MDQQQWSRWLDERPTSAEPEQGSVVPLRPAKTEETDEPDEDYRVDVGDDEYAELDITVRPILVVGACGGAGATTTVLGLAGELATAEDTPTVAVDATAAGGDLALRGADARLLPITLQSWLYGNGSGEPAPLGDCMSRASSGIGLLWRDEAPLRGRGNFQTVGREIGKAGYTPVYDGGAPVAARQLRPLLADPELALVLVIPARVDAANRLRVTLEWLDDEFGAEDASDQETGIVGGATIVVSHQLPGGEPAVAEYLRENLSGWVRDVTEIPYDSQLARGELVTHSVLADATRAAYRTLLAGVLS